MGEYADRAWTSWGQVYNHYKATGIDLSDAAYRADEWEKRVVAARRNATPHCKTCTCSQSNTHAVREDKSNG